MEANPLVDQYLEAGCGRCPLGGTPDCKVHAWDEPLRYLRRIVLATGLTEELKWGVPCYTWNGKNILILSAFKDFCSLNFFKGVLLRDEQGILVRQGDNQQSARILKFTSPEEITPIKAVIRSYIFEAIEVEKAGLKVDFKAKNELVYPEELLEKFQEDPGFEAAFEDLTPGRKRGYILHISQAKQAKTRTSRIEKCMPKIFEGKGLQDR